MTLWPLVLAVVFLLVLLVWFVYRVGHHDGRLDAYRRLGQVFRAQREKR